MTELTESLDKLVQGVATSAKHVDKASDTSEDDSIGSPGSRKFLSKKAYRMKTSYATDELGRLFANGPTDDAGKLSLLCCRIGSKDVSALTHGHYGILRHFHGARHFPRDHRLPLENPGWRAFESDGSPLADDEVEKQREKICWLDLSSVTVNLCSPRTLLVDESGAAISNLPGLGRVSSLMEVFRLNDSYELVERFWSQFVLTAGPVDVEFAWSRDEVLVSSGRFT